MSIIEFMVYGLIGYSGIIVLMISVLIEPPTNISLAGVRAIWLMPSVLALTMLMFMSGIVVSDTVTTETTITKSNSNVDTEVSVSRSQIQLIEPVWATFHLGLFLVEVMYIIVQVVNILRIKDE